MLQAGIAKAVDQCVNAFALFAPRAVAGIIALVIAKVVGVKDGSNGVACALCLGGKDCANANYLAAVIVDRFHSSLRGITGGNGCCQDQHMFARDHGRGIFAEQQLAAGGVPA